MSCSLEGEEIKFPISLEDESHVEKEGRVRNI